MNLHSYITVVVPGLKEKCPFQPTPAAATACALLCAERSAGTGLLSATTNRGMHLTGTSKGASSAPEPWRTGRQHPHLALQPPSRCPAPTAPVSTAGAGNPEAVSSNRHGLGVPTWDPASLRARPHLRGSSTAPHKRSSHATRPRRGCREGLRWAAPLSSLPHAPRGFCPLPPARDRLSLRRIK